MEKAGGPVWAGLVGGPGRDDRTKEAEDRSCPGQERMQVQGSANRAAPRLPQSCSPMLALSPQGTSVPVWSSVQGPDKSPPPTPIQLSNAPRAL